MDIISHALIGRVLVTPRSPRKDVFWVMAFAALPDLFQIPLYLFLGYVKQRPFWIPLTADWTGFRAAYPEWILWWDIPHSFLFLGLVITPWVLWRRLNRWLIAAYFSHLFVDLFTHTGEWGVKPFFPVNYIVSGFTDAWAWDYWQFPIAWAVLVVIIWLSDRWRTRLRVE